MGLALRQCAIQKHTVIKHGKNPYLKDPPGSGQGKTVFWKHMARDSSGFGVFRTGFPIFLMKLVKKWKEPLTGGLDFLYSK